MLFTKLVLFMIELRRPVELQLFISIELVVCQGLRYELIFLIGATASYANGIFEFVQASTCLSLRFGQHELPLLNSCQVGGGGEAQTSTFLSSEERPHNAGCNFFHAQSRASLIDQFLFRVAL